MLKSEQFTPDMDSDFYNIPVKHTRMRVVYPTTLMYRMRAFKNAIKIPNPTNWHTTNLVGGREEMDETSIPYLNDLGQDQKNI